MYSKEKHLDYIKSKGRFRIDCNTIIFSKEDIEILETLGYWFQALTNGELEPITEEQKHFILVAQNKEKPVTNFEDIWFRYLGRKRIEKEQGSKLKMKYEIKDNSFYSRKDAKKLKRMMFGDMNKRHKE